MNLSEHVKKLEPALLACLQENLRIPSVQEPAEAGSPYGSEVRRSLDHVLAAAAPTPRACLILWPSALFFPEMKSGSINRMSLLRFQG